MKRIVPMDPQILCKKIDLQKEIKGILLPGQEGKVSQIRKVLAVSKSAESKNIAVGDIVVTRSIQYPVIPLELTENNEVPYDADESVEILDCSQVIALYKDEKTEK